MLFDDPLSAVDPKVAKSIFEDCIRKGCKDKIVILVTHQIQFLDQCPKIMLIKDGSTVIGDFDHISASGFNVKDILDSFNNAKS
jgi:ATP-binding cassette subfamily C (CFTR/MRP) protein 4